MKRARRAAERDGRKESGDDTPHVAILGAGPIGLEAALAAAERGYSFRCYEAGERVATHVRDWEHVRLFTPWELNISARARRRLSEAGHELPADDEELPLAGELVERVLEPLASLPEIASRLRPSNRVVQIGRDSLLKHESIGAEDRARRPFRLLVEDERGQERVERADVVMDCTGTWGNPNALGAGGIPAPGERSLEEEIERGIPDVAGEPERWRGRAILLVGAGHSAQTAARDLARLAAEHPGTRVIWALRREDPTWNPDPDDPLPARRELEETAGELARGRAEGVQPLPGVAVERLERTEGDRMRVHLRPSHRAAGRGAAGGTGADDLRPGVGSRGIPGRSTTRAVDVDRIVALTGSVGEHRLYRQLQVHECYATSGPMKLAATLLEEGSDDCMEQTGHGPETLLNPEPHFFILGSKSYGRNSTFLLRVGWEQVDEVFGWLEENPPPDARSRTDAPDVRERAATGA